MVLKEGKNNRFLIYFFFDKDGVVDRYIDHMLQEVSKCVKDMLVICNGPIKDEGKYIFSKYTNRVVERDNIGFDVGAYKEAINIVGWEELCEYDELIMMNYTIMGPVFPLQEMFDDMDSRDIDYWGPSIYHRVNFDPHGYNPYGYFPDHIQSHFIAVRNTLLVSKEYRDYWKDMPFIESYQHSVGRHESFFTKHFEDMGYKWDVYADTRPYRDVTKYPCEVMPTEMIRDLQFPFFKRKCFVEDYTYALYGTAGECGRRLYDYIESETEYDINLIWDNLLRTENLSDIKHNLQLNYILPSLCHVSKKHSQKRIALVMHMYFPDLISECLEYANSMPKYADIYITTNTEEKKELIEKVFNVLPNNVDIRVVPNRGRDVGPFLIESKDYIYQYDYICHTHDKKVSQVKPLSIGKSFSNKCFENTLSSLEYVDNIISLFEQNSRLGMVMPPPPNHSDYFFTLGKEWGENYEITCDLAKKLNIKSPMSEKKELVCPIGSAFWARPEALRKIFDYPWNYDELPEEPVEADGTVLNAVERIYSYAAQDMGYYSGWILSEKGASNELTNLHYMLRTVNEKIIDNYNIRDNFSRVVELLDDNVLRRCCEGALYFDNGNGIDEQCKTRGFCERKMGSVLWTFGALKEFGEIKQLRFDPCDEGNLEISGISIDIYDKKGNKIHINEKKIVHNGKRVHDKIIFIKDDPNILIRLKKPIIIDSVWINIHYVSELSEDIKEAIDKCM